MWSWFLDLLKKYYQLQILLNWSKMDKILLYWNMLSNYNHILYLYFVFIFCIIFEKQNVQFTTTFISWMTSLYYEEQYKFFLFQSLNFARYCVLQNICKVVQGYATNEGYDKQFFYSQNIPSLPFLVLKTKNN